MPLLLILLVSLPALVQADEEDLERRLLELERDIALAEEALAAPPDVRFTLYLETEVGALFQLQSVRVELDGHALAARLYRREEVRALARGGVDRLHLGALAPGEHRLTVLVTGTGPHRRPYRLGVDHRFHKDPGPLRLIIRIRDDEARLQPRLEVAPW